MLGQVRGPLLLLHIQIDYLCRGLHTHSVLTRHAHTQAKPYWEWNNDFMKSNNITNNLTAGYYRISSQARSFVLVAYIIRPQPV